MSCRNVILFPNGNKDGKGKSISVYLSYDQSFKGKLFVDFILRVKNQKSGPHIEKKGEFIRTRKRFYLFSLSLFSINEISSFDPFFLLIYSS